MNLTTRAAAVDQAYATADALHDIAAAIRTDLLPVPLSIEPPYNGNPASIHLRVDHVAAWLSSLTAPQVIVARAGFHVACGRLDDTDTTIRLTWIDNTEATSVGEWVSSPGQRSENTQR